MAKKKTTDEEKTTTIVETTEEPCIVGVYDYRVVPVNDVLKYLHNGYTLTGGPVVRFNDLYQAVTRLDTKEVSAAEFEAHREKYKL